jgi:prophage tail gpP-like protein
MNVRVTVGMERMPNDFSLAMTERYPGVSDVIVVLNESAKVMIGNDLVISGYVERYQAGFSPDGHAVGVSGRGKCADLLDCAAEWPGGQISSSTAASIAEKLCEPYGLNVRNEGDPGPLVPKLVLNLGESAFEIIERVCRFAALLVYEDNRGDLVLSGIGKDKAASGFREGINVVTAELETSADQQFSEYQVVRMAMDVVQDIGDGGNLVATVANPNITRHRRRIIVAEGGDAGAGVAQQRAAWECNRRFGRSAVLRLTTDSWRDSAGLLYRPNTLVDFSLPTLKLSRENWLISEVTYRRDDRGTACDLVIMHPSAFLPQPVLLQPAAADIPSR